ncbi:MAG: FkbM family methyltransferase [Synergistaceae bacterium]|nr:FkbM family methyltransferase [Synergistaceae bacterium]
MGGGQRILLYGAGKRGEAALRNLKMLGYEKYISGFLDDKTGKEFKMGQKVINPENLPDSEKRNSIFFICTYAVKEMASRLINLGVQFEHIFYLPELLITDYDLNILAENSDKIKYVENILADGISKFIYKSVFEIYKTGNIGILSRTMGKYQYFPVKINESRDDDINNIAEFKLSVGECFIDCGAYDGDTIKLLKEFTGDKFRKIYAFEADAENYSRLVENYKNDNKIRMFNAAVYSKAGTLYFAGDNGTSSSVSDTGNVQVNAVRLDDILKGDESVSFIKMDIEGSELEALKGAENIIKRFNPKLAVCIYHNIDDLWEIPLYIHSICKNYKLYIRNYEDRLDEIVCYAVL